MQFLKQSTAVDVRIGPAVDATDGVTPETTLALGTADQAELLKHDGAATVDITGRTFATVTGCDGWYDLTLTTTDTNTLGQASIVIQDSSLMLPIFKDYMVVPANVWDSMFGADKLQVDVAAINNVDQAGIDFEDMITNAYNTTNNYINSNIMAINTSPTAAGNLEDSANTLISTSCTATTTGDLVFSTNLSGTYTTDDGIVGRTLIFRDDTTTAALRGVGRTITSYVAVNGVVTVSAPLPASTVNGDTFIVA